MWTLCVDSNFVLLWSSKHVVEIQLFNGGSKLNHISLLCSRVFRQVFYLLYPNLGLFLTPNGWSGVPYKPTGGGGGGGLVVGGAGRLVVVGGGGGGARLVVGGGGGGRLVVGGGGGGRLVVGGW